MWLRAGVPDYALRLSDEELARYRMMAERAQAAEEAEWELAGIGPGARVADVGCGPGALLPLFSATVRPEGRVDAVDGDSEAVAAAQELVRREGLANVTVALGSAAATGLEAGAYDTVNMRHVLAHNGDSAQQIVDHLATLARPGGCVLLVDIDGTALRLRPENPVFDEINERYREFQQARGGDMRVGLRLDLLLASSGLDVEAYRGFYNIVALPPGVRGPAWAARDAMLQAGVVSQEDIERWAAAFAARDAQGEQSTLFASLFVAVGRKPAA
jgi:SAM-dependent methyltransferase